MVALTDLWICPCQRCPNCGHIDTDPEYAHPEDGLAYCHQCQPYPMVFEWWATCGPFMDGSHPTSPEELAAWDAVDLACYRDECPGTPEAMQVWLAVNHPLPS